MQTTWIHTCAWQHHNMLRLMFSKQTHRLNQVKAAILPHQEWGIINWSQTSFQGFKTMSRGHLTAKMSLSTTMLIWPNDPTRHCCWFIPTLLANCRHRLSCKGLPCWHQATLPQGGMRPAPPIHNTTGLCTFFFCFAAAAALSFLLTFISAFWISFSLSLFPASSSSKSSSTVGHLFPDLSAIRISSVFWLVTSHLLPTVILPSPLLQEFVTMPPPHPPLRTALPHWNETVFRASSFESRWVLQAHLLPKMFICMFLLLCELPLQLVHLVVNSLFMEPKKVRIDLEAFLLLHWRSRLLSTWPWPASHMLVLLRNI